MTPSGRPNTHHLAKHTTIEVHGRSVGSATHGQHPRLNDVENGAPNLSHMRLEALGEPATVGVAMPSLGIPLTADDSSARHWSEQLEGRGATPEAVRSPPPPMDQQASRSSRSWPWTCQRNSKIQTPTSGCPCQPAHLWPQGRIHSFTHAVSLEAGHVDPQASLKLLTPQGSLESQHITLVSEQSKGWRRMNTVRTPPVRVCRVAGQPADAPVDHRPKAQEQGWQPGP